MVDHPDRLTIASKLSRMVEMHAAGCSLSDLKGCLETTLAHVREEMMKPALEDAKLVDVLVRYPGKVFSGFGGGL